LIASIGGACAPPSTAMDPAFDGAGHAHESAGEAVGLLQLPGAAERAHGSRGLVHLPAQRLKERQNSMFRVYGMVALVLGAAGFAPSICEALLTGALWSVSHDARHTNNDFLGAHAVGAVVWTVACIAQLNTGGVPKHAAAHRVCGYVGSAALLLAMVLAAANELKYATPESALGNAYTLLLVLGASGNMLVAVVRGRQKRFPEHKDGMLLAIMFTMDPAVHRLAMWSIRFAVGGGRMTAVIQAVHVIQGTERCGTNRTGTGTLCLLSFASATRTAGPHRACVLGRAAGREQTERGVDLTATRAHMIIA